METPSFCKILTDLPSKLALPRGFTEKYHEILPRNAKLRIASGTTWEVIVEKSENEDEEEEEKDCYFFTEGWSRFLHDTELERLQILVFSYAGDSTFHVTVYTATGSEKESKVLVSNNLCFQVLMEEDHHHRMPLPATFLDKHNIDHDRVSLKLKTDPQRTWGVKIEKIDGLFYFVDGWSVFVNDNGVSENKVLVFHIVGGSTFQVSIEDSCMIIPSPPPYPPSATIDKDEEEDDKGEPTWRLVKKLKDYMIADKRMEIPRKFAVGTGLDKKLEVDLVNEEGKRRTVGITSRNTKKKYCFSRGWPDFITENNLKKNNILLLEYVGEDDVVKVVVMDEKQGEKMVARASSGGLLP